jgi:Right handed beta helix region
MTFIIREGGDVRFSETLVLGNGLSIGETAVGVPELLGTDAELVLHPSGGDDTQRIRDALAAHAVVRLGPGVFHTTAVLHLQSGQVLTGTGVDRTELQVQHTDDGILIGDGVHATIVERLRITGPGNAGPGKSAITTTREPATGRRLVFRDLRIEGFHEYGIYLEDPLGAEIADVSVQGTERAGIYVYSPLPRTGSVSIRNVTVEESSQEGVVVKWTSGVDLSSVFVSDTSGPGILLEGNYSVGGGGVRVGACQVRDSDGIRLVEVTNAVVEGCEVHHAVRAFQVVSSYGVAFSGCRALGILQTPYHIEGGGFLTFTSCTSDQTGQTPFANVPHIRTVTDANGRATEQTTFVGFRKVNSAAGITTVEADVSQASGRVVFIQHNLDTAKVVSGGHFVAL